MPGKDNEDEVFEYCTVCSTSDFWRRRWNTVEAVERGDGEVKTAGVEENP